MTSIATTLGKTVLAAALAAAAAMSAQAAAVYQTGANDPWGVSNNEVAMDTVFGDGNWTKSNGFSLAEITGASFAFLDGSDSAANELNAFLTSNIGALESYVSAGGHLFLNAAPNQGGNIDFGFGGVTLNFNNSYDTASNVATVNQAGIDAGLTAGGLTTSYTGTYFSHATVSGGSITSLIDGSAGSIFAVKSFGKGFVAFGGQTTTNFHSPFDDSQALRVNELKYVANAQTPAVPEPETYALIVAGLGVVGATLRRRKAAEAVAA